MIAVITGGRDHWLTLAELERLESVIAERGVRVLRDGWARGVDKTVAGYLRARGARVLDLAKPRPRGTGDALVVEPWPADWTTHGRRAGPLRNRAMLDGLPADLAGYTPLPRADLLVAFHGGDGTRGCREAAAERGIEIVAIEPVAEPRIWNMHHRWSPEVERPPGLVYVGRSARWGGPSPLANPWPAELRPPGETRAAAAPRILGQYRRWLWGRIQAGDAAVLDALDDLAPEAFIGCTCWPAHCHGEVVVRAWRYLRGRRSAGVAVP